VVRCSSQDCHSRRISSAPDAARSAGRDSQAPYVQEQRQTHFSAGHGKVFNASADIPHAIFFDASSAPLSIPSLLPYTTFRLEFVVLFLFMSSSLLRVRWLCFSLPAQRNRGLDQSVSTLSAGGDCIRGSTRSGDLGLHGHLCSARRAGNRLALNHITLCKLMTLIPHPRSTPFFLYLIQTGACFFQR